MSFRWKNRINVVHDIVLIARRGRAFRANVRATKETHVSIKSLVYEISATNKRKLNIYLSPYVFCIITFVTRKPTTGLLH